MPHYFSGMALGIQTIVTKVSGYCVHSNFQEQIQWILIKCMNQRIWSKTGWMEFGSREELFIWMRKCTHGAKWGRISLVKYPLWFDFHNHLRYSTSEILHPWSMPDNVLLSIALASPSLVLSAPWKEAVKRRGLVEIPAKWVEGMVAADGQSCVKLLLGKWVQVWWGMNRFRLELCIMHLFYGWQVLQAQHARGNGNADGLQVTNQAYWFALNSIEFYENRWGLMNYVSSSGECHQWLWYKRSVYYSTLLHIINLHLPSVSPLYLCPFMCIWFLACTGYQYKHKYCNIDFCLLWHF